MMPEWFQTAATGVVLAAGLGLVAALVPFFLWLAVQVLLYLRDNGFRKDVEAATKYMLWLVLRKARRPEADALRWAPPEVEKWARDRMRHVLKMDKEVP